MNLLSRIAVTAYELIEWGAAEFFGGDLGMNYLGTQGDVWDAQKDMALAALGALVAMPNDPDQRYPLDRRIAVLDVELMRRRHPVLWHQGY